jgi:ABC-2 type transport system ATP-binding protein
MADEIAIKVDHVSKTFKLPHEKNNSIKSAVVNFYKRKKTFETQEVLKDVSFDIKKGEFFGIVGRNGSGKSTLLKMIAGIYSPSEGGINVNGKITPFIELGVGFSPELTGRENVFLNGALLGFNRKEMSAMYDDIVSFAEIEKFMDQKLKNYSSGMQVRLAFSIAIRARSSILLLDEVLAVGDEAFQRKCFNYFETLKRNKKTVVIVTHDMSAVERFCSRAMFIEGGKIQLIGNPNIVAAAYSRSNDENYKVEKVAENVVEQEPQELHGLTMIIKNSKDEETNKFTSGEQMTVSLSWDDAEINNASVTIVRQSGECMYGTGTYQDKFELGTPNKIDYVVTLNLQQGEYYLQVGLGREGQAKPVVLINSGPGFVINRDKSDTRWDGFTKLEHEWKQ